MKIHREGFKILVILFVFLLLINIFLFIFTLAWISYCFSVASLGFLVFVGYFFRSPERQLPEGENRVVSPADGTVVVIENVFEKEYFQKDMLKVSIFMSVWNVHLNRIPVNGRVVYQKYHPGKYLLAFHEKSSELNERNSVVFEDNAGRQLMTRQIAGTVARRICPYTTEGQVVVQGNELGFIRFGSRVDIFLPLNSNLKVGINEKVFGITTVIAEMN